MYDPRSRDHHRTSCSPRIHSHSHYALPLVELCCFGALFGLAINNPRFAAALAITIVAVVVVSCLATLAMSVTGETLLSIFLVGMVIAGIAALCNLKPSGSAQSPSHTPVL